MVNLSYEDRKKDYKAENISLLNEIIPASDKYQAQKNYESLMKQTNEELRRSGQPGIEDNKINPFLKGLLKLIKPNKQL